MRTRMVTGMLAGLLALTVPVAGVEVLTAKQALAKANARVEPPLRDQLIMIQGDQSDTLLRPRVWDVTLYDETRPHKACVVRVKDGAAVNVASGIRMFDGARWRRFGRNFTGYVAAEVMDLSRWALDSDKVLAQALHSPKLDGLEVTGVRLLLRKASDGNVPPLWRVELLARPKQDPAKERWIGYLEYNAETGDLLVDELRVEQFGR